MSDQIRDRYKLPGQEEDSPRDRYTLPGQNTEDPWNVIRRLPQFQELLRVQELAQKSRVDPSVGNPNQYLDRVEDLTDEILTQTGLDRQTFNQFFRSESANIEVGNDRVERVGRNVLGAVGGLFEPLQAAGDSVRTFGANLADVQGERVAREAGRTSGGRTIVVNPQEGTFQGDPASNPLQAAVEMGRAAGRTVDQLGFTTPPLRRGEEGNIEFNPESGWVVYSPSVSWDRFRVGVSPYEADLAVTGRDFNERFDIAERFGVESEQGKEWLGLGTEVLSDPFLWADWMFLGAKVTGAAGRATNSARAINTANRMEQGALQAYKALTPAGAIGRAADVGRAFGITDAVSNAVTKGINNVLDIEVSTRFLRQQQRAAAGTMGFAPNERFHPKLRDLIFQHGRVEGLSGGPLEFLTGSESFGLSIGERALGQQRVIRDIAIRGAKEVSEALTDGIKTKRTFRLPWMKVQVPNANTVTPEMQGYVRGVSGVITDYVDTQGIATVARSIDDLPNGIASRLRQTSSLYDIPIEQTMDRFNRAVTATRKVVAQVGYETSGYRDFTLAMKRAAANMGVDYPDVRRAYERMVGGVDLQNLEADNFFPTVRPGSTGAVPSDEAAVGRAASIQQTWKKNPDALDLFENNVRQELEAMGRNDLSGISPATYLEGMKNGYLRRMFAGVEDPVGTANALASREIVTLRSVQPEVAAEQFRGAFESDEVANVVRQFLESRSPETPRGLTRSEAGQNALSFKTDDLARLVSRRVGRDVTPEEVANVLYRDDNNAAFLQETIDTLMEYSRPAAGTGAQGAPFGQTPRPFTARQDFDLEDLARRVQLRDPVAQVAEVGLRGGRQVRAQEFIGRAFDGLTELDLVRDAGDVPKIERGMGKWVTLPKNPQVWGPLAGKAIPQDAARLMVHTVGMGAQERSNFDRVLSMWRRGLLAPLSTSLRNVVGNFLLIQQAGGDLSDMLTQLPKASALRRQFIETGRLPDEFKGYEHLFSFLGDSTRTSTALPDVEELLQNIARGKTGLETAMDQAESIVDWGTRTPPLGFLDFFKWGEEISRTTALLSSYGTLRRAGRSVDDSINRAAHFATNSAYNYGATPLLPDWLRRTGLAAFPQFTWFTAARTARVALQNPAAAQRVEYARQAANIAGTEGDLSEQERITAMMADYLKASQPVAIPVPGEDGSYYVLNLQYWLPQGANVMDLVSDPLTAGVFAPIIDSYMANLTGSGVGPFGARFGQRVFSPGDRGLERAAQTAGYLTSQVFAPGATRVSRQIADAVKYNENKELFDLWGLSMGRYYDSDWGQLAGRIVGLNTREVSVKAHNPSYRQQVAATRRKYDAAIQDIDRRLKESAFLENEDFYELQERLFELKQKKAHALERLSRFVR